MFKKILILNRGEIALRIIRSCKEMGIKTVAVHSICDSQSLHVKFADESVCIGENQAKDSYLNMISVLSAAEVSGADAIHPGYGFLSENSQFVEVCNRCGIKFIGPTAENIKMMGNKIEAKRCAQRAKVNIIPGSDGAISSFGEVEKIVKEIGFPIILKAAHGGGGRGMQIIKSEVNFEQQFLRVKSESKAAFGSDDIYIEKFFPASRHVEVQIIADTHGNVVTLGERECSIQRRHQKIIEEAPCCVLPEKVRKEMHAQSVALAKHINYSNAGTIEYLVDEKFNFYFIEMNTRIQVEHPVTEMISGIDIVKEQILAANGEKLSITQDQVELRGHSIECRVNAENPKTFAPSPGKVLGYYPPGGYNIRVDSVLYDQYEIPPYYDSLIAKLIVYGKNREEAIQRMLRALDEYIIEGVDTNIPLHVEILNNSQFRKNEIDTQFLNRLWEKNR